MKRADLIALAERVEKAMGADREIDLAIQVTCGLPHVLHGDKPALCSSCGTYEVPHYTASLDAALTLVPKGHAWTCYGGEREEGHATAYCVPNGARVPWPRGVDDVCAATPALAMTAAAIRARAKEARDA